MSTLWPRMTATDLGRDIGAGRINPVDLTEFFLDRIASHPQGSRIFARTTPDRARYEAMGAAARAKAGQRYGVLDGVPVSWKDLFDTANVATEAGTALLRGRIPPKDAEVLATASLQGAVCLGKTHMTELAFSGLGLNPVTASPPCINDENAVSGGSSSGAAASVAFGLAPAAIGSDTGGSVRVPAAWNDLVGLKTTAGRLSLTGVVPLAARFDTVGPIARSVEDCAALMALLEGGKPADLRGASLQGMRFLVLDGLPLADIREAPAQAFQQALTRLSVAGARLDSAELPEAAEAFNLSGTLVGGEAYGTWGRLIESAPEKMFPRILERFRLGAKILAMDFVAGWQRLEVLRQSYAAKTAAYDVVLVPTSPILPPDAQRLMSDSGYFATENLLAMRNTRITNMLGLCALTLPTGVPSTGISLMAAPLHEERLLRIARAAEMALG